MAKNPFLGKFEVGTPFRPQFNVGCILDIMTGRYERGMKGESILNGGMANIEGWTGPGNSFKSTLAHFRMLKVLFHYSNSIGFMYDTENSGSLRRIQDLSLTIDPSGELAEAIDNLDEEKLRFMFTDSTKYNGSEWWNVFRDVIHDRIKNQKEEDTPFLNTKTGKCYTLLPPLAGEIDSFSQFQTDVVFKKSDKGTMGDSELNTIAIDNARGKSQLIDSLPYLAAKGGFSIMLSAHMGNVIQMDKYAGDKKQLAYVKNTRKMKKTTESFTFIPNNLFEITGTTPALDDKKFPKYPRGEVEASLKGITDMTEVTVLPIRTKGGITGFPFTVIVSQRFGVQEELTEFDYIKSFGRYGLNANTTQQRLDLYPDKVFTRNNFRDIADEDPRFRRALHITAEMCVIRNLWPEYADRLVPPAELYQGLKDKGYDWNVLLDTRSYWVYDQYTHPIPFLSTDDLLRMYHGTYHPYWMKEKPKGA